MELYVRPDHCRHTIIQFDVTLVYHVHLLKGCFRYRYFARLKDQKAQLGSTEKTKNERDILFNHKHHSYHFVSTR